MLVFAFFGAVFASACWLIYASMFIIAKLNGESLASQDTLTLLEYAAAELLPVLTVWLVFGYVNQFLINRSMNKKQNELLTQLQKNQDYTDLVVRVMLDAEHEIKDGFMLNKFDTFISDMNEALSEIISRCNIASSAQLDQLWQRVRRGEKQALGKAVLEASKSQSTFNAWVKEKAGRDNLFRGSLLEFCSRYQNLLQLLEKHDRDRNFLMMLESGVFGKVYSVIAPLTDSLGRPAVQKKAAVQNDYASALKLATMEEPKAEESIINVDKSDASEEDYTAAPKESLFAKLNPFRRREAQPEESGSEDDPFFRALHNSFNDGADNGFDDKTPSLSASPRLSDTTDFTAAPRLDSPQLSAPSVSAAANEPRLSAADERQERPAAAPSAPSFDRLRGTLDSLRATREERTAVSQAPAAPAVKPANAANTADKADDEDLIYPFGGRSDENNFSA